MHKLVANEESIDFDSFLPHNSFKFDQTISEYLIWKIDVALMWPSFL
jgi:hypothetical protein